MKTKNKILRQTQIRPKISLLVACYNEEKSLKATIQSCLRQSRKFDELVFVDDSSTDDSPKILAKYSNQIKVVKTPKNTGNKSSAQELGLRYVTGDIFVTTDADTLLDKDFVKEIEKSFTNKEIVAAAGYVRSLPYNWLTSCRAFDYCVGQRIHKLAEYYMRYIFVIPGAASAFRTSAFRKYISFDHDTITEDLDFTYKLHQRGFRIMFNSKAIIYTQDPSDLKNYINQLRRWFGGGWQNLRKHWKIIPDSPTRSFELTLIYGEGVIFSALIFIVPILNWWLGLWLLFGFFIVVSILSVWVAWQERRPKLLLVPFYYFVLFFINAYIYLEQFNREIIHRQKNLVWFKPERYSFDTKKKY